MKFEDCAIGKLVIMTNENFTLDVGHIVDITFQGSHEYIPVVKFAKTGTRPVHHSNITEYSDSLFQQLTGK